MAAGLRQWIEPAVDKTHTTRGAARAYEEFLRVASDRERPREIGSYKERDSDRYIEIQRKAESVQRRAPTVEVGDCLDRLLRGIKLMGVSNCRADRYMP